MQLTTLLDTVNIKESSVCSNQFNRLLKHPRIIIHLIEDLSKLTMAKISKIIEACRRHHKQEDMLKLYFCRLQASPSCSNIQNG